MMNDNMFADALSPCAAHNPTDVHVSYLPPMSASRATTKNKRTLTNIAGGRIFQVTHSGACEINARPLVACKVATSCAPPCHPQSQCWSDPDGPTDRVNIETGVRRGLTTKRWSGRLFRSHRTQGFGAEGLSSTPCRLSNSITTNHRPEHFVLLH